MSKSSAKEEVTELLNAAAACYTQGRLQEAAQLYRRAAAAAPQDFRPIYSLALIDIRLGELESARDKLSAVLAQEPNLHPAQQNFGSVCQSLNRWDDAAAAFARAHKLNPAALESHFSLARALAVLGRLPQAIACYQELSANPAVRLRALTGLAALDPASVDAAQLADLTRAAQDPRTAASTRIEVYFALAQVLERRGSDKAAFAALNEGNRLQHEALAAAADEAVHPETVEREQECAAQFVIDRFDPEFLQRRSNRSSSSKAPIFIVGMPRSGSTLIEQILSSHPQVQGMGDSGVLARVLDQGFAAAEESGIWRPLAVEYLASMRKRGWSGDLHFVDKTPENYLRVGAIHSMFPNAVVLESVRDPVDTCLSCYRHLFTAGNETLYDLAQIGRVYVQYRRVMEHWRRVLPGRVIQVEHETLVADPPRRIRWLIEEACRLKWHPACLDFHDAPSAVRPTSAVHARPPVFQAPIGRWNRVAEELGPLFESLGWYRRVYSKT